MTARKFALLWALCVLCVTAGCGGSKTQIAAAMQPVTATSPAAPALNLPPPLSLRSAAYTEATISRDGSQFSAPPPLQPNNLTASATKGLFDPNWMPDAPDPSGLAYGCYQFT